MESMHTDVWVETGYNLQIPGTQQTYLSTSSALIHYLQNVPNIMVRSARLSSLFFLVFTRKCRRRLIFICLKCYSVGTNLTSVIL